MEPGFAVIMEGIVDEVPTTLYFESEVGLELFQSGQFDEDLCLCIVSISENIGHSFYFDSPESKQNWISTKLTLVQPAAEIPTMHSA